MLKVTKTRILAAGVTGLMALTTIPKEKDVTRRVSDYFEQVRRDPLLLTTFFAAMPKGGDLHHHFSGSVYGETYWQILSDSNGWINTATAEIDTPGRAHPAPWKHFAELPRNGRFDSLKQAFLRMASVKDFNESLRPSDEHFFATFSKMSFVAPFGMVQGLRELKQRAVDEQVQYIETQVGLLDTAITLPENAGWEKSLVAASLKDSLAVFEILDKARAALLAHGAGSAVDNFFRRLEHLHQEANIDDTTFMLRYQLAASRLEAPLEVYRRLLLAFEAVNRRSLVVGVNLLKREDGEVSMRDYRLHMLMFAQLSRLYPEVPYSLHAGELAMGMVRPEQLRTHITDAVLTAGAKRIGHGVAIAYETACRTVLDSMARRKVPVEINLSSNEFILKVKNEQHPVLLYHTHQVPVVICTDDAGVLRTDLTRQFVLLATRYPSLHYADIKQMIINSIQYSFIYPAALKKQQLRQLEAALARFEAEVLRYRRPAVAK
ncbi:adenosine deaminase [Chitinophaga varians]|uniref:adenosine deaminase n=1 Tax=Chitinophaga varians TaxID=2202339 RepID=UPI00165F1369|nr:adenosine deaminase [Chitinophaga varians]MBC9909915.1 adenosine deaminase [Chitinophaga varians]